MAKGTTQMRLQEKKGSFSWLPGILPASGLSGKAWWVFLALFWVSCAVLSDDMDEVVCIKVGKEKVGFSIKELARKAGLQVIFQSLDVEGVETNPVSGCFALSTALETLLDGTHLNFSLTERGVIVIVGDKKPDKETLEMKNKKHYKKSTMAALLSALGISQVADAQVVDSSVRNIEEIVVTAQKRAQSIQDVPITMVSHSGEGLSLKGIDNVLDLSVVTPGLNMRVSSGTTVAILRGVGTSTTQAGQEPSVATYVDDVYNPSATGNIPLLHDIERVEVLKGPQGTLFGRNATGGLIHVITKNPTYEPEMKVRLGYGRFDTREGGVYGSVGILDNLAANISVSYRKEGDSYLSNVAPGADYLPEKRHNVRGKLLYEPTDRTEVILALSKEHFEGSSSGVRQPLPGVLSTTGEGNSGSYYRIANDLISYSDYDARSASLHVKHSLDGVDLVNIIGWRDLDFFQPFDNDGSRVFGTNSFSTIKSDFISEEFRLVSTTESNLDWILGFFYSNFSVDYDPLLVTMPGVSLLNVSTQENVGWAVFGEIQWHFTDSTSLLLGVRYNEDEQKLDQESTTFNGFPLFPKTKLKDDFDEITYKIGLNHKIADNVLLYGLYSRGYKTGGFNMVSLGGAPEPAVQPEILDAFEIGVKTSGWLDGRVVANGAIFYYDYQDLQVQTIVGSATRTDNAAEATIFGGEFELMAELTENFFFSGSASIIDSEYDEFIGIANVPAPNGLGNVARPGVDFSGNKLFRASDFTFNAALDYYLPLNIGTFIFTVNYFYDDGFYWDSSNRLKEDAYDLLNVNLTWKDLGEKVKISAWARNIGGTKYSARTDTAPLAGDNYAPAPPETYGVTLEYSIF